jgi:hypothetical protein
VCVCVFIGVSARTSMSICVCIMFLKNRLFNKTYMSSHVGPSSQEVFHKRMRLLQWNLGGQPRETSQILIFLLRKASPGAYRLYKMNI